MKEKIFVHEFYKNFGHLKSLPIVLYGIGQYTKLIVESVQGFNFVGLMDSKTTGETIYGLKVLEDNEVIECAEVIIIVSNLSVSETIYSRIRHLEKENGIKIYFLNGLTPTTYDESIFQDKYWNKTTEKLKFEICKSDVVSFDIFDTLIMRACLEPTVIFDAIESYLKTEKNIVCDYKCKRIEAEKICYRTITKYFDFQLIYEQLKVSLGLFDELIEEIKKKELELEYKWVIPRHNMIDILNYSKKIGKKVVLTSDMYLNKSLLLPILEKCNIFNYDNLFVSCEDKMDKHNGTVWGEIKKLYPSSKILHIGDNLYSDIELPKKFGIRTFEVKKSVDILRMSGIGKFITNPKTLEDYFLLGMFSNKLLNDPFSLCKTKGKLHIENMFDFGYLFFGPIVLKYILWLFNVLEEQKIDIVLFPSRDGYVLEQIYSNISRKLKKEVPKGIYFFTSRRAASVATIKNEEDIIFIINEMCNISSTKVKDILNNALGVRERGSDVFLEKTIYETGKQNAIDYIILNYKNEILRNAEEERKSYEIYINKLGLEKCKNIGIVNFVGRGITQKFITKLIGKEIKGLYFATEIDILQYYDSVENIFTCYGSCLSTHTSKLNLLSKYLFGEVIFSAPQEQLLKFDNLGNAIYLEQSDRDFTPIEDSHRGIMQYIEDTLDLIATDYISLPYLINFGSELNSKLVDDIFGIFLSIFCSLSDEIKQSFKFYDSYGEKSGVNLLS